MEKFESLVAKVNFKLIGLTAYNRQQILERTRKEIGEDVILRKGEMFYFDSTKYRITEIVFVLRREEFEKKFPFTVYSQYDNNFTNCDIEVFAEIID
ncbi:hypothetical protein WFZ85_15545 [Flavobacterium sp. j3]|uniref:Uncharacterized protein n=1 Tax=Flavobacterium aureirubrum TaxID=3133147 RepID=A0ABU9N8J7_9FLAO